MTRAERVGTAAVLGAWGALIAWFGMSAAPHQLAKDFSWPWRAARFLLDGHDPYVAMQATGPYPFNVGLFYPLPAGILAIPFAPLDPAIAGASFVGLSAALLAWAVSGDAPQRLWMFASAPFAMAALLGQWSPILTAAALLPALQFTMAAKPNIGLVAWLYRPSWKGAVAAVALGVVALAFVPRWPLEWLEALKAAPRYRGPAFSLLGAFTLLAALRWRRPEGRLMLGMALVPQLALFYDQLPIWLVPHTWVRSALLTALSWMAWFLWYPSRALESSVLAATPWILLLVYAPALVMLLGRPRVPDEDQRSTTSTALGPVGHSGKGGGAATGQT